MEVKENRGLPLVTGIPPLHPYPLSYPLQCLLSLEFWNFPSYNLPFTEGKPRNRHLPSPVLGEMGAMLKKRVGGCFEFSTSLLWNTLKRLLASGLQYSPHVSVKWHQSGSCYFLLRNKSWQNVASWNNLWLSPGSVCGLVSLGWFFFEIFYVVAVWEGWGWSYLKAQLGWMSSMASSFVYVVL